MIQIEVSSPLERFVVKCASPDFQRQLEYFVVTALGEAKDKDARIIISNVREIEVE